MSRRAATWTSVILLALLGAGCGAGASADASRAEKRTTTTTAAPRTTTTTVPPPYSFDGSVPPPPLMNTGTDYAAIVKSLDDYGHWLYAHHPDRTLVGEIAVTGSEPQQRMDRDMATLIDRNLRIYDTASVLEKTEIVSVQESAVSLRLHYSDDAKVLVDKQHEVLDTEPLPTQSTAFVLLNADSTGRWRFGSVEYAQSDGATR
jgi:hypothetical protein